jgi:putative ATP-binding cassette transporter
MRANAGAASALERTPTDNAKGLRVDGFGVTLPDGARLIEGAALAVHPGDTVMLQGPSGSGKSTLFRAFAGIWPFARGRVSMPDNTMFIPQRPYVPDGRLRDALAYPQPASSPTPSWCRP